ncbi:MAG: OmpA family protein [Candidatus Adiutrix sp.]|jgi:OOP family OmpA-OmpF porin|nr:OmpA family protein [Candidatus Adiutrix sp.]
MHKLYRNLLALLCFAMLALTAFPALADIEVQVMSVQDQAAAEKEAARLFDMGIPAFSRAENVPELGLWNRVYIGPFETEADAAAAAETLKKQAIIKEFIVKTESAPAAVAATGAEAPAAPATPGAFELPVAQTPTYGEPVSPEMARELGLAQEESAANAGRLPTYGESAAAPRTAADGTGQLPPGGLKPGDDMPGLLTNGGGLPAAPAAPAVNSAQEPVSSARFPAPSAGDEAPIMVAQAEPTTFTYNAFDDDHDVVIDRDRILSGFTMLVDLSSSMRRMSNCPGYVKEEATATLLRKMNRRIPDRGYNASLRVFGYQSALLRKDLTTLYYGPATYNREALEDSLARLVAADAVSPFGDALQMADGELANMGSPKAVLMFSDFESMEASGDPVRDAANLRRRYGSEVQVYTFHTTRQASAVRLARAVAEAGGGKAYDMCRMVNDDAAFESMMMEIFGVGGGPCTDADGDGVCDDDDLCPDTPQGAPVDSRGCWVAAYSQFFDFDKAEVKSEYLPRLSHAANLLIAHPEITRVVIAGHTDNVGDPEYNLSLGRFRAQTVRNILVNSGVDASRLVVESYGETRPIGPNDSAEGRARNRRVEFHIGDMPANSFQN